MSEAVAIEAEAEEVLETSSDKKPKKAPKAKKRPSDFEIFRTIVQRTNERKLPYLLKNFGEDEDILFLCSEDESGFVYGSSSMTLTLIEFDDPELKAAGDAILTKMHGHNTQHQVLINLRDQISELSKTKGEKIDVEAQSDDWGSVWTVKKDTRGQERTLYYSRAVESLFHFELVSHWCKIYRPLLKTDDPNHLYYPYTHPAGDTYTILSLPAQDNPTHPITALYPNGFRTSVTRGIDLIITKAFEDFPYPVVSEEVIVFLQDGSACQMAHRVVGQGWRMLIIRPNAILFPTLGTTLVDTGHQSL